MRIPGLLLLGSGHQVPESVGRFAFYDFRVHFKEWAAARSAYATLLYSRHINILLYSPHSHHHTTTFHRLV